VEEALGLALGLRVGDGIGGALGLRVEPLVGIALGFRVDPVVEVTLGRVDGFLVGIDAGAAMPAHARLALHE